MRRPVIIAGAVVLLGFAAYTGWEFLQLGRTVPPLASAEVRATSIVVDKQTRRITLLRNGEALKSYEMSLGGNPVGHKQQEGDSRTPEGNYAVDSKNPRSRFHLAMHLSYPNASDLDGARRRGVSAGGDIMIHGLPNGLGWLSDWHLRRDWTDGCIAVTNAEIEEIWAMVDIGTGVQIKP
ncbi:L,D-transpeptidase family protein [Tardiphaga robiniae]|uniref:L,D-transpeptidase family protein n=1 Tax=Tardiphaga robiniae TaxID=943830 RepID=UPI000B01A7F6|nr:L,D-transpeptidase family protein [Tardiphaga robiniae]